MFGPERVFGLLFAAVTWRSMVGLGHLGLGLDLDFVTQYICRFNILVFHLIFA